VKEQSHKDEMSRALRGDFERLRGRGVSTTLAQRDAQQPDAVNTVTDPVESRPDNEAESTPKPGWFERLRGR
jgi:hypothetical protein